jgi:hypothetical protein
MDPKHRSLRPWIGRNLVGSALKPLVYALVGLAGRRRCPAVAFTLVHDWGQRPQRSRRLAETTGKNDEAPTSVGGRRRFTRLQSSGFQSSLNLHRLRKETATNPTSPTHLRGRAISPKAPRPQSRTAANAHLSETGFYPGGPRAASGRPKTNCQ